MLSGWGTIVCWNTWAATLHWNFSSPPAIHGSLACISTAGMAHPVRVRASERARLEYGPKTFAFPFRTIGASHALRAWHLAG